MEYEVGLKFRLDDDYTNKARWCNAHDCFIEEIEPDAQGRVFQICQPPQPTQTELAQRELNTLLQNLSDTDYIANKLIEAETSEEQEEIREEYSEILAQRRVWRARAGQLKDLLSEN